MKARMTSYTSPRDLCLQLLKALPRCSYIKREFDLKYPSDGKATSGVYHCLVGGSVRSHVRCRSSATAAQVHQQKSAARCSV